MSVISPGTTRRDMAIVTVLGEAARRVAVIRYNVGACAPGTLAPVCGHRYPKRILELSELMRNRFISFP